MQRALFALIAAFWILMNALLIRSEFGSGNEVSGSIPISQVWQNILTAPDDSSLAIMSQGQRIGSIRWVPNVGEDLTGDKLSKQVASPDGMIATLKDYRIDGEGNVSTAPTSRVRFSWGILFNTNHQWREFTARLGGRPATWQVKGDAARNELELRHEAYEKVVWEQKMSFDALRHPELLLAALSLGGTAKPGKTASAFSLDSLQALTATGLGQGAAETSLWDRIHWSSRHDTMKIGRSKVRVFLLEARLTPSLKARIFISRVGEILRVELPGELVLVNEAIERLPGT